MISTLQVEFLSASNNANFWECNKQLPSTEGAATGRWRPPSGPVFAKGASDTGTHPWLLQYWVSDGCCRSVPQFGFGCAEDAVRLLHLRPTVAGVVHLQAVVQLVQVLLHLLDLLPGHVLQAKAHLAGRVGGREGGRGGKDG